MELENSQRRQAYGLGAFMKQNDKLLILTISKNDNGKWIERTEYFAVSNIYDVDFWINAHKKVGWKIKEYSVKDMTKRIDND